MAPDAAAIVRRVLEGLLQVVDVLFRPDLLGRERQKFLFRITVEADRRLVDREEGERLRVDHPHGIGIGIEQRAVAFFALLDRLLVARALGDVLAHAVVAAEFSLLVEQRLATHRQITQLARLVVAQEDEIGE